MYLLFHAVIFCRIVDKVITVCKVGYTRKLELITTAQSKDNEVMLEKSLLIATLPFQKVSHFDILLLFSNS